MNAFMSEAIVRDKLEELRREAAASRLARSVAARERRHGEPGRLRAALGVRLVRLGVRLGGEAAVQ